MSRARRRCRSDRRGIEADSALDACRRTARAIAPGRDRPGGLRRIARPDGEDPGHCSSRPQHAKPARGVRAVGKQELLDLRAVGGEVLPVRSRGAVEPRLHVADGVGRGDRRAQCSGCPFLDSLVDFQNELWPVQEDGVNFSASTSSLGMTVRPAPVSIRATHSPDGPDPSRTAPSHERTGRADWCCNCSCIASRAFVAPLGRPRETKESARRAVAPPLGRCRQERGPAGHQTSGGN